MRRVRSLFGIGVTLVLAVLLLPGLLGVTAGSLSPGHGLLPTPPDSIIVTLHENATSIDLAPNFWGTTVSARAPMFGNESALVQATPARVALWPGANAGDDYDPFNNTLWANDNSYTMASTSEQQFITWCKSIHCTAIFEVPGVIDNATVAAEIVNNTENNLSFHPAYWEIGNEPGFWAHWGQMWGQWTSYTTGPTPIQYADEVQQYVTAMRKVDPTVHLIGLPGVGRASYPLQEWISDMIDVDGPNLSAVAVHIYPDLSGGANSLGYYFSTLNGTTNSQSIPARVPNILQDIQNDIPSSPACQQYGCGPIPIFFTEIGSAISGRPDATNYSEKFAGGLYVAAEFTQAFAVNASNVDAYGTVLNTANSWFDQSGNPRPEYTVYTDVLGHLGTRVYPVTVTSASPTVSGNVYATSTVAPSDGSRADLLVVNTNVATNVSFAPLLPGIASGTPMEAWMWNGTPFTSQYGPNVRPATPGPVAQFFPEGVPSNWTVPPMSLVVLEARPGGGAPVQLTETGLGNGTRWYVGAGSDFGTSTTPNITFFLPTSSYTTDPGPTIAVPYHLRSERWAPPAPASFSVGSAGAHVMVPFQLQYAINLSSRPFNAGAIGPATGWANAGSSLALTATPAAGLAFVSWYGWGLGSVNSSTNPTTIRILAPLHETAIFGAGFPVSFTETGLATGSAWSVVLRNSTVSGSASTLMTYKVNGTYGFQVPLIPGYSVRPDSSYVVVRGSAASIQIHFTPLARPYPVTWTESGLPAGTSWSVTVRGTTYSATTSSIETTAINGSYTYYLGNISGYQGRPAVGGLTVNGGPVVVAISWGLLYGVTFVAANPVLGANWSVAFANRTLTTDGASLAFSVTNDTWHYGVTPPKGYAASPRGGTIAVQGHSVQVTIDFYVLGSSPFPPTHIASIGPPSEWVDLAKALAVVAVLAITGVVTFAVFDRRQGSRPAPEPEPEIWDERFTAPTKGPEYVEDPVPR